MLRILSDDATGEWEGNLALKIAVLAVALILAWVMLAKPFRNLPRPSAKPKHPPAPLEACARCGVYRPAGEPCDCDS